MDAKQILDRLNKRLASEIPEANAFGFLPPAIPGLGSAGGFSFWLQDRSGGSVDYLDQNLKKFLAAARKRPELSGVNASFATNIPQIYADVDRDKVLKQSVAIGDVYQTMQAYLGGLFVNQFNRFGRQWKVFVEAEGDERAHPEDIGQYDVRSSKGGMVPLSAVVQLVLNTQTVSICIERPRFSAPRLPATALARPWTRWSRWQKKPCPQTWATTGPIFLIRKEEHLAQPAESSRCHCCSSF
jgi:multidrug efflux pump subunit AcrB